MEFYIDWDSRNYFEESYYDDALRALESRNFVSKAITYNPVFQIGVWLVERIDLVLQEENHEERSSVLKSKAIETFVSAARVHWDKVEFHMRNSIGARDYRGLLDTEDSDIYRMWLRIAGISLSNDTLSDSWLTTLAETVINDTEFSLKVSDVRILTEQGMDAKSIFEALAKDYGGPSKIRSLEELGILRG